jgi:predicted dithiol-disulfide oxidoreductase (DUF899 family)
MHENDLASLSDRVNAERRRLPMVKLEKNYVFEGPDGKVSLKALFENRRQLIIYHFKFDPAWDEGCPDCTGYVNVLGDLSLLHDNDTSFALVSRAPLPKLEAYKMQKGWAVPWLSSFGSDFNHDFHVTLDAKIAPAEPHYLDQSELQKRRQGEQNGLSVFFQLDEDVYHTYSAYAQGAESFTDAGRLLDTTPYGRQRGI